MLMTHADKSAESQSLTEQYQGICVCELYEGRGQTVMPVWTSDVSEEEGAAVDHRSQRSRRKATHGGRQLRPEQRGQDGAA